MGEQSALKVFSLTSTGPGICSLTCAIDCELFHKRINGARKLLKIMVGKRFSREDREGGEGKKKVGLEYTLSRAPEQSPDREGRAKYARLR
jgi:hypothetical protein